MKAVPHKTFPGAKLRASRTEHNPILQSVLSVIHLRYRANITVLLKLGLDFVKRAPCSLLDGLHQDHVAHPKLFALVRRPQLTGV